MIDKFGNMILIPDSANSVLWPPLSLGWCLGWWAGGVCSTRTGHREGGGSYFLLRSVRYLGV